MSISPHEGHSISRPKAQIAGHAPFATGIRAFISKRPYKNSFFPAVVTDEEVYSTNSRFLRQSLLPAT